jgi:hypothetical protein
MMAPEYARPRRAAQSAQSPHAHSVHPRASREPRGNKGPAEPAPACAVSAAQAIHPDVAAPLDQAAELLDADPDAAALVLDGLLNRLAANWYVEQGQVPPDAVHLLSDLERRCQPLGWLLRLALRAPDVHARLAHVQGLAGAMLSERRARLRDAAAGPALWLVEEKG